MKKLQLVITILAFFTISTSAFAQSSPKVIAIVSKASWCPVCVQNEARVMKEVLSNVNNEKVQIVAYDLSDATSKKSSAKQLLDLGLNKSDFESTGVITFVNAKTKIKISSIVVNKSSVDILKAFENSSK
jgi:thiol-disulfide isomerase/thioredoxin